jgi:hypothetical protein
MWDFDLLAGENNVAKQDHINVDLAFMPSLTMLAPEALFQGFDVGHGLCRAKGRIPSKATVQEVWLVTYAHRSRAVDVTNDDGPNCAVMVHGLDGRSEAM